jgi:hypothetical protein
LTSPSKEKKYISPQIPYHRFIGNDLFTLLCQTDGNKEISLPLQIILEEGWLKNMVLRG